MMNLNETLQQAIEYHQAGQLPEAEELYLSILQVEPAHPEANHNLGLMALQLGKAEIGFLYLENAWKADPSVRQYWFSLTECLLMMGHADDALLLIKEAIRRGIKSPQAQQLLMRAKGGNSKAQPSAAVIQEVYALFNSARYAELEGRVKVLVELYPNWALGWSMLGLAKQRLGKDSESAFRRAVELTPNDAETHNNLGATLKDLGKLDEAVASYRRALKINPNFAEAHINLGVVLKDLGKLDEAVASYRRALKINPNFAEAHNNMGIALKDLGQCDEAVASYQRALEIKPEYAEAHSNLGVSLKELGRFDDAVVSHRRALEINPSLAEVHGNLGIVMHDIGQLDEAAASFHRALRIKPDLADAHNNLGNVLKELGQLENGLASYRRALEISPDLADAHNNVGIALQNFGKFDDAVDSFRQALKCKPDYANAHSNLIFCLDLVHTVDLSELHGERKKWDEAHAAPLWQEPVHMNDPAPARRLRVGYISADFKDHSAVRVFGGMLTQYDRSLFDVFAYSNLKGNGDKFTELFKQNVTVWRSIAGLPDEAVAKMIRKDGIDILVDLSGHTAHNRLLVFAHKPAPIQITAWGYATGTGMRAMDVFFTDTVMVPLQEQQYFTEEVRYLPSAVGAFFSEQFPDVNELPALSGGIITFGSFNRLVKVSAEAYRVWAEVLLAIPRSRLILKAIELSDPAVRESVIGHFVKAGVAADRIIMQGRTSWYEQVQAYHQIDIALDPLPHGGGVTTLECLMMGVPTITLRWPTTAGRVSASIMTTLGLTDWIAETQEQYVALAIQKAADLQSLEALRQRLRGIFTSSVIGDQAAYVRAVEQEYRQLWREWCAKSVKL